MTCPEWTFRTARVVLSGMVSGLVAIVSGTSVDRVRNGVRGAFRTNGGHVGSRCPEWVVSGFLERGPIGPRRLARARAVTTERHDDPQSSALRRLAIAPSEHGPSPWSGWKRRNHLLSPDPLR